jgi:Xaa-Pro aminopeptidase
MTGQRLNNLRAAIEEKRIDGLLISDPDNRRYLSGFVGTAGYLFITRDSAVLATDFRYTEQAALQAPDYRIDRISGKLDWLPGLCAEFGVKKLGFEADDVTVSQFERFRKAFNDKGTETALESTTGLTLDLRAVKDEHELGLLSRAIEIGDEAFDEVSDEISQGMTEIEVAERIERAVKSRGAESISFDTIVAAGPNAARPHHRAGDTVLREGQTVVVDMGARYQGYCSDLTRTIVLGKADDKTRRIYDIVLSAQLAAIELVEAGMTGGETDMVARKVIQETGHGDDFGHSLGHGVGLQVHENPGVGPNSKGELKDGMVFTIEPGIYLQGWGGVRIEDVVVLEQGKARVLSKARKLSP